MIEQNRVVKYRDAYIITGGNIFYQGEATVLQDGQIDLSIFFNQTPIFRIGDKMIIKDILVDPSNREDLFTDVNTQIDL